jgi:formate-dependent nitrite reductase cytochrome c552 subunit
MMKTFTSINNLDHSQHNQENSDKVEMKDAMFYESIKSQLDMLKRDPSEESISKILAYSRIK